MDPKEIDTFVAGVKRLEESMARHVQTFESLELDSDVFGRLPGISGKIHDAYSKHVAEGTEAFAEGRSVLNAAAERGASTAQAYREVEKTNISAIAEIRSMLHPVRRA